MGVSRILICGSRNWTDRAAIAEVIYALIQQYGDEISIIHGACKGADVIAGEMATRWQLVTVSVPAKWDKYNNGAGRIRNQYMLDKCKPHLVIAFHADLENSKGTGHMVSIAKDANVRVIHIKNRECVELISNRLAETH